VEKLKMEDTMKVEWMEYVSEI